MATGEERARWLAETAADERVVGGVNPSTGLWEQLGSRSELVEQFRDAYAALGETALTFEEFAALRFYTISGEADILNSKDGEK